MNTIIDSAYLAAQARGQHVIPVSDVEQVMVFDMIRRSKASHVELPRAYRHKLNLLLRTLEGQGWPGCALTEITVSIKLHRFPVKHYEFVRETRAVYCDETGTGFTSQGELFDFDMMVMASDLDPSTRDSLMVTIDDILCTYGLSDD